MEEQQHRSCILTCNTPHSINWRHGHDARPTNVDALQQIGGASLHPLLVEKPHTHMKGTTWEACLGLWPKGAFRQDVSSEDTNMYVVC